MATTQTAGYGYRPRIRFDCSYLGTKPGALHLLEWLVSAFGIAFFQFGIANIISEQKEDLNKSTESVIVTGSIFYALFQYISRYGLFLIMIFYIFHVVEVMAKIPWYTIEIVLCGVSGILSVTCGIFSILICSSVNEYYESVDGLIITSACLCFGLAPLFFYDVFLLYKMKSMQIPPQGQDHGV